MSDVPKITCHPDRETEAAAIAERLGIELDVKEDCPPQGFYLYHPDADEAWLRRAMAEAPNTDRP